MEIWSSCRCAVMQHQCTAALVRAKQAPHCSVLLCKLGSEHACVTGNTPVEICSSCRCAVMQHHALQHCSGQNSFPTVQGCSAKQPHIMLEMCSSCRCAVMQHQCTAALSGQNSFPTVQGCSAKQPHNMLVPLQLHLCAVMQHQCTAALIRAK